MLGFKAFHSAAITLGASKTAREIKCKIPVDMYEYRGRAHRYTGKG